MGIENHQKAHKQPPKQGQNVRKKIKHGELKIPNRKPNRWRGETKLTPKCEAEISLQIISATWRGVWTPTVNCLESDLKEKHEKTLTATYPSYPDISNQTQKNRLQLSQLKMDATPPSPSSHPRHMELHLRDAALQICHRHFEVRHLPRQPLPRMRWAEDAWFVFGKPLVPAMFVIDIWYIQICLPGLLLDLLDGSHTMSLEVIQLTILCTDRLAQHLREGISKKIATGYSQCLDSARPVEMCHLCLEFLGNCFWFQLRRFIWYGPSTKGRNMVCWICSRQYHFGWAGVRSQKLETENRTQK